MGFSLTRIINDKAQYLRKPHNKRIRMKNPVGGERRDTGSPWPKGFHSASGTLWPYLSRIYLE